MRFALRLLAALVVGLALGLFLTWATVWRGTLGGTADGPWRTTLLAGSHESGPYLRARVALHGLFALNRGETIYYTATRDSSGARLTGACSYRIVGHDPRARWWSITAYGPDDYLIPNPANRYSVSNNSIVRDADGGFIVIVAKGDSGPNWIPVEDGPFSLSLRLYNPEVHIAMDPATVVLPAIIRAGCA